MILKLFLVLNIILLANPFCIEINAFQNDQQNPIRLEELRWQYRILMVFGKEGWDIEALQRQFRDQNEAIEERAIRYFLFGKDVLSNGSEILNTNTYQELKDKYQPSEAEVQVILIGKDGEEKYRKDYLDFPEIYRIIDAMPMRKQEIAEQKALEEKMLINFSDDNSRGTWWIINDGVMGGLSKSELVISDEGTAIFRGNVSLENYGGFSSTRSSPRSFNLKGYRGLHIRIKGDGKKYQLRLQADNRFNGVAYQYSFNTQPSTWISVRAPFDEFIPAIRGRFLSNVPPVLPEQIRQIGFLIGDKQAGPFQFEIESIRAYK